MLLLSFRNGMSSSLSGIDWREATVAAPAGSRRGWWGRSTRTPCLVSALRKSEAA